MATRRIQEGTTVVEFAIVAVVFFTVLFAMIDFSRIFFSLAALDESTRRGARVAAVCPVNDPYVKQVALFNGLVRDLTAADISVDYLDIDGNVIGAPSVAPGYGTIRYVRVGIRNFQFQTIVPGLAGAIQMPSFETTIPSESLGRVDLVDVPC